MEMEIRTEMPRKEEEEAEIVTQIVDAMCVALTRFRLRDEGDGGRDGGRDEMIELGKF